MELTQQLLNELYICADKYFKYVGFTTLNLNSKVRRQNYVTARRIFANILFTHTKASTRQVGLLIHVGHAGTIRMKETKHYIFSDIEAVKMLIELQELILPKLKGFEDPYKKKEKELLINLYHNCI